MTVLLSSAASWGALGGHVQLRNGLLEINIDDREASSQGVSDLLDLFQRDGFEVQSVPNGTGSIDLLRDGGRFSPVALYGVIYRQEDRRGLRKARFTVPVTDQAFLALGEGSAFLTLDGQGAKAVFEILRRHGTQTMSDSRILRFERGEVLCYLRHEDGGHYCMIDL